jgi:hypothetical protein
LIWIKNIGPNLALLLYNLLVYNNNKPRNMGKSKTKKGKAPKKAAPLSGMVVKNSSGSGHSKGSSIIPNQNVSSSKKGGGMYTTPRKAG